MKSIIAKARLYGALALLAAAYQCTPLAAHQGTPFGAHQGTPFGAHLSQSPPRQQQAAP